MPDRLHIACAALGRLQYPLVVEALLEVRPMDRLPQRAAATAALVSLTLSLAACGGGSSGTATPAATPPGPSTQAVNGVSMPNSVSVVTAKNAP